MTKATNSRGTKKPEASDSSTAAQADLQGKGAQTELTQRIAASPRLAGQRQVANRLAQSPRMAAQREQAALLRSQPPSYASPVQRVWFVNNVAIGRALIAGHRDDFIRWTRGPLAEAGRSDIAPEEWDRIFHVMTQIVDDEREFRFERTSHLMRRILNGQSADDIFQATALPGRGDIFFANVAMDNPKYRSKATDIIQTLKATKGIREFLANKSALITLKYDSQLASVTVVGGQVQIVLSPWFFEQESRGRIMGMLLHEFGVHPLANEALTEQERAQERNHHDQNHAFATGAGDGHVIRTAQAGQRDHVFAAVSGQARFAVYRRTAYEMVCAMLASSKNKGATVTAQHVTDAIHTYLADIAMILATNDHRGQMFLHPVRTAECFNIERARWLQFLASQGNKEIAHLTPGPQSGSQVFGGGASLGAHMIFLSKFRDSTSDVNVTRNTARQGPGPITGVQRQVMEAHGLQTQGAQAEPNLFEALDAVRGAARGLSRLEALQLALDTCFAYEAAIEDAHDQREVQRLRQALTGFQQLRDVVNTNGPIELSMANLRLIARAVKASCICVIGPDGKMMFGFAGSGGVLTVLRTTANTFVCLVAATAGQAAAVAKGESR